MFISIAQAASEAAPTSEGLSALGVNLPTLAFQILNFAVLFFVLQRYAYKPVLAVLEKRRQKIEESLRNAKDIAATRAAVEVEQKKLLQEARQAAAAITEQSRAQGKEIVLAAQQAAAAKAEQIVQEAQAKMSQEMNVVRQQLRQEVLQLVVLATGKVVGETVDAKIDHAVVEQALQQAEKELA